MWWLLLFLFVGNVSAGEPVVLGATATGKGFWNFIEPFTYLTPGKTDPALTKEVLCSSSFRTGRVRHVTEAQKKRIARAYGLDYAATKTQVEYDHLISLELGGSNDDANIWPEFYAPVPGAHEKDKVENYLHREVCAGHIGLKEAQDEIAHDWYNVYLLKVAGR